MKITEQYISQTPFTKKGLNCKKYISYFRELYDEGSCYFVTPREVGYGHHFYLRCIFPRMKDVGTWKFWDNTKMHTRLHLYLFEDNIELFKQAKNKTSKEIDYSVKICQSLICRYTFSRNKNTPFMNKDIKRDGSEWFYEEDFKSFIEYAPLISEIIDNYYGMYNMSGLRNIMKNNLQDLK